MKELRHRRFEQRLAVQCHVNLAVVLLHTLNLVQPQHASALVPGNSGRRCRRCTLAQRSFGVDLTGPRCQERRLAVRGPIVDQRRRGFDGRRSRLRHAVSFLFGRVKGDTVNTVAVARLRDVQR